MAYTHISDIVKAILKKNLFNSLNIIKIISFNTILFVVIILKKKNKQNTVFIKYTLLDQ